MTKRALIDAYVSGGLGRRAFVRGLTALGVSAGAAMAYAHTLRPAAAATGGVGPSGFVMRAQQDGDDEYATACELTSDAAGGEAVLAALQSVLAILDSGLEDFGEDDLPSLESVGLNIADELQTMRDQVAEQVEALETLVADLGGTPAEPSVVEGYDSADAFLAALADALNAVACLVAGVVPAIEDAEVRQTLMSIAVVVGRHAGFANVLVGKSSSLSALEQPCCP